MSYNRKEAMTLINFHRGLSGKSPIREKQPTDEGQIIDDLRNQVEILITERDRLTGLIGELRQTIEDLNDRVAELEAGEYDFPGAAAMLEFHRQLKEQSDPD